MEKVDSDAIQKLLDELVEATRKGTINWKSVNPTTYVWERGSRVGKPAARMTLQIVDNWVKGRNTSGAVIDVKKPFGILHVIEMSTTGAETPRLSVDGRKVPEFNERLVRLYDIVVSGVNEKGLDFFKGILAEP